MPAALLISDRIHKAFVESLATALRSPSVKVVTTAFRQSVNVDKNTVQFDLEEFSFSPLGQYAERSADHKNKDTPKGYLNGAFLVYVDGKTLEDLRQISADAVAAIVAFDAGNRNVYLELTSLSDPDGDIRKEESPLSRVIRVSVQILTDAKWR